MPITKPHQVITSLRLTPGNVVADFGCGDGHYIREIEDKIGSSGTIYAIDIQRPLLDSIVTKNKEKGLETIIPIWTDLDVSPKTNIASSSVNAIIIANVLFMLHESGPILREAYRILKHDGEILVIDWHTALTPHIPQKHAMLTKEEVITSAKLAGFQAIGFPPAGSHQYAIIFKKQR